jgi:histidine triad (HIT) family protein
MDCLFCKIIKKEIPSDIVYEDESFISFKDINPKAPIHLLIVPKKHISSINHLEEKDKEMIGELFLVAKRIAEKEGVKEKGYKLLFNVGKGGGQIIDHIHLHLLAGWDNKKEKEVL